MTSDVTIQTERALLGMMIEDPSLIPQVMSRVPADDWTGVHSDLVVVIQGMSEAGEQIDPLAVVQKLQDTGLLLRNGGAGRIFDLTQAGYNYGHLALVDVLATTATRRRLWAVGTRLVQMSEDPVMEPETVTEEARKGLDSITLDNGEVTTLGWPVETHDPPIRFVIPDLLAEDDRAMITGFEGGGKTVLLRQLVASVVVGRHPFLFSEFDPQPALHIDLENPQYISDNAYRAIKNKLMAEHIRVPDLLHRLQPRMFSVFEDRDVSWLMRVVRKVQPKLVAIGPLKNMVGGQDLNEERVAVKACDVLNRIRAETGAALVVEAHASWESRKVDWRPRGSSAIVGWPEFGFGMKPLSVKTPRAAELVTWRGARAESRYWPEFLAEGTVWPWVEDPRVGER